MGRILVTGAAGFIGSHLCEGLLAADHDVIGVDDFADYYPRSFKEANVAGLRGAERFELIEADLLEVPARDLLEGIDHVYHLAAQPGVRASWGDTFDIYTNNNILTTQRLLEAARNLPLETFVLASTSSVYGDAAELPMTENATPRPYSPYGVSKLAAEGLCYLYNRNFGVPTVTLRFFTVFGPRQRPDMAFHRFIKAILAGDPVEVFGDGDQTRDFTYVADTVAGCLAALGGERGAIYNIGGGHAVSVNDVLDILGEIAGRPIEVRRGETQAGDVRDTLADTRRLRALGYAPATPLADGLRAEYEWLSGVYGDAS